MNESAAMFMFLSVVVTAGLSFLAVIIWITQRQKEREAYYRSETIKKVAESSSSSSAAALEYLRESERVANRRIHQGLTLGGLLAMAVGFSLLVFLFMSMPKDNLHFVALIPIVVGATLFLYTRYMAPKE